MNYELAKKLKEAGFKQGNDNGQECDEWIVGCYVPTLSELIEACGDRITYLRHKYFNYNWAAWFFEVGMEGAIEGVGSTPEEAVANLWLKLNESRTN